MVWLLVSSIEWLIPKVLLKNKFLEFLFLLFVSETLEKYQDNQELEPYLWNDIQQDDTSRFSFNACGDI